MIDGPRPVRPIAPQLVMGLLIIAVGILFTLENLGVIEGRDYFRYWPAGLIAVGLLKLWHGRGRAVSGGFVFVFAGTWLLLETLGIVSVSLWNLWPILLVVAGATMVWRGFNGRRDERATADTHSTVSAIAVLAGLNRRNTSKTFRGGDLTAIFGGCQIDLRQASIEGEAVIDVFAMWGGIEIRVPENWSVSGRVTPVLGGYDDKTTPVRHAVDQQLVVRGLVIMGGVEIKN
ncbi:MAG: LiaI-LiaF-like domain-containing protein [Vicinamibacterales bacterium]